MVQLVLVCGGYEGQLRGYQLTVQSGTSANADATLTSAQSPNAAFEPEFVGKAVPIFALSAHAGCVRALACGGELLVSGGSEHTIGVYNVRKRREYGKLLQQDGGGALNCLRFYGRTHMISAGDDGEICIWRTSDWECLLRLKGHKGPVLDLAIHPSGRIALSVGNDKKLMLWNLTTGAESILAFCDDELNLLMHPRYKPTLLQSVPLPKKHE